MAGKIQISEFGCARRACAGSLPGPRTSITSNPRSRTRSSGDVRSQPRKGRWRHALSARLRLGPSSWLPVPMRANFVRAAIFAAAPMRRLCERLANGARPGSMLAALGYRDARRRGVRRRAQVGVAATAVLAREAILLVRCDGVGDAALCIPSLEGLRRAFPHAVFGAVCSPANATLFSDRVDRVYVYDEELAGCKHARRAP